MTLSGANAHVKEGSKTIQGLWEHILIHYKNTIFSGLGDCQAGNRKKEERNQSRRGGKSIKDSLQLLEFGFRASSDGM